MPSEIFIESAEIIIPYITIIVNYMFDNECYPDSWTKGVIVPIPKKGDLSDVNNYRGITLISSFSKIFSLIVKNRLEKFAEENAILCEYQWSNMVLDKKREPVTVYLYYRLS